MNELLLPLGICFYCLHMVGYNLPVLRNRYYQTIDCLRFCYWLKFLKAEGCIRCTLKDLLLTVCQVSEEIPCFKTMLGGR